MFPRAIIHVDGDAFFASCEQSMNPKLKGKPIVTGSERGIASAVSYEAKKLGIKRAMPIHEIKRKFPQVIIVKSDYESYNLYSQRMYEIVERYTPVIERYGIDECFADLTGQCRPLKMSYRTIIENIKRDLEAELDVSFSIGLGPSKVIAKVASNYDKPSGLVVISGRAIHNFLKDLPINKIWGIGTQTGSFLRGYGINTALDFANKDEIWVAKHMSKPYAEIWMELRGNSIYKVEQGERAPYKSIMKSGTFTPPSKDKQFIFAQLSKNIENACIKARRHNLVCDEVKFFLKKQDFSRKGIRIKLDRASALPLEISELALRYLGKIYEPGELYRSTGAILGHLRSHKSRQADLFGESLKVKEIETIYKHVDELDDRYGKNTVMLASSLNAMRGHKKGKHFGIPLMGNAR